MALKREIVREKIIQAAQTVFEAFGPEKTTLEDLGRAAGMNKTSLYYYFENKEELYAELISIQYAGFQELLGKKMNKKNSLRGALRVYLSEKGTLTDQFKILHRARYAEISGQPQPVVKILNKIKKQELAFLKDLLVRGVKAEELKKDADKMATALYTVSEAFAVKGTLSAKDADLFTDFLLNGMARKAEKPGKKSTADKSGVE
jgi:AcrR family transcriptional regulator